MADKSLTQIFNKSIKDVHKSLPQRLENLLIISSDEPIFISPEIVDILSQNTNKLKDLIKKRKDMMTSMNALGLASRDYYFSNQGYEGTSLKLIALNTHSKIPKLFYDDSYKNTSKEHSLTHVIDHEIGHLIVREGWPSNSSPHIAECAADAYATIRHIQRFGTKTDFFKAYNRSHLVVFNLSPIHYTSAIVSKVEQLSNEEDLSKLGYLETATLAGQIANKYSQEKSTFEKLETAFFAIGKKYKEETNRNNRNKKTEDWIQLSISTRIDFIKDILDIMLKNKNDHDIYRAGKQFIERKNIKDIIQKAESLKNTTLKKPLAEIAQFEKASGIILNQAAAIDAKNDSKLSKNRLRFPPVKSLI